MCVRSYYSTALDQQQVAIHSFRLTYSAEHAVDGRTWHFGYEILGREEELHVGFADAYRQFFLLRRSKYGSHGKRTTRLGMDAPRVRRIRMKASSSPEGPS